MSNKCYLYGMIKRMTMKFSEATHADLIWLADHLQAGNMTATVAELVHAEVRRVKGLPDDPRWGLVVDPKEVAINTPTERQVITRKVVEPILEAMAVPADPPQKPNKTRIPPEKLKEIADAVATTPIPEVDLDHFKEPEPVEAPKQSRFKVYDPLDPAGSKPKYSEDQAGAILWTKEKKEYEDSLRVVLTGARVG